MSNELIMQDDAHNECLNHMYTVFIKQNTSQDDGMAIS